MTEGDFKSRYYNHRSSFRNENKKDETRLSCAIWNLNKNPNPKIKWSILKKAKPYKPGGKMCNICNWEIFFLIKANSDKHNINSRTEITGTCRHINKHKLNKAIQHRFECQRKSNSVTKLADTRKQIILKLCSQRRYKEKIHGNKE